jgi:hypothetical protein
MRNTKVFVALLFVFLSPVSLRAQGLFQALGFPATVASTGQTELIGLILASMTNGPALADTLVIDVSPLQVTNANASDIAVTATGMTLGVTTIDTENNLVQIPVLLSNASSGLIRIQGIRVAVAGMNVNSLNARLRWLNSRNAFTAGGSVPVIKSVQSGLAAQWIIGAPAVSNGQVSSSSTIELDEGFPGAFSNSSQYGQTGPTEVQITVTDFPAGGQMTFPASVTANETAATLTTSGGYPVVLTGNGTVLYVYFSAANSGDVAESFDLNLQQGFVFPAGSPQPKIQVTLAPIGAAVPNATFPSTSIPRYTENEMAVPPAAPLTVSKMLYWTGINPSLQNQVEITNPNWQISNLTIDAFDANGKEISGMGVTNPVKVRLAANQSIVSTVSDLFGTGAGISTVRIQSTTPDLRAAAAISGNGVNQAVPFISAPVTSLILPVVSGSATLQLMNPNTSPITGTLTLFTTVGQVVSTASAGLPGLASKALSIQAVFGSVSQSGYASAVFSSPVIAYESFGANNLEAVQPPASGPSVLIPFVAGGSSFQTNVNLINLSGQTVTLNAQLFTAAGSSSAAQPITMQPGQQITAPVQQIFSQSPGSGYIELGLPQSGTAFFTSYPLIAGQAEIASIQSGSAVIPLSSSTSADAFIFPGGNKAGSYVGIAFLNPTASKITVTAQALNLDGSVAATATLPLDPGQMMAQLTSQLFNISLPAQSIVHITSSAPIAVTSISGSTDSTGLVALPVM